MKRRRFHVELTDRQQLIVGLVLVVLVAVSLLYCLGFASVALRQAWENGPLHLNGSNTYYPEEEGLDLAPTPSIEPTAGEIAPQ